MNFSVSRTLNNNIFLTQIKCVSFGDAKSTALEEEELIKNIGPVIVETGGLFTGKCKIVNKVVTIDELTGESVSFVLNSKKIEIKPEVIMEYSVDASKLSLEEIAKYPTLIDPLKIAEAKCVVFEAQIKQSVVSAITLLKAKETNFETVVIDPFQA